MIIKLGKGIFFSLAGLIFFLIIYRLSSAGKFFNLDSHLYYQKYYLIALSFCFFALTFHRLGENFAEKILLVFFSTLFALYTIETTLTFLKISKRGEDKRSIKQFYLDQKKIDSTARIYLPPTSFLNKNNDLIPISHKSNSLIIDCNELGYYSMNKSDRYGFNNSNYIWDQKINYFFIGDSFIYGQCVFRKDNIATLTSNLLKKNILNIAMPGNGFLLNYVSFREFYEFKKPEKIIWFINDRDYLDIIREIKNPIINKYLIDANFKQDLINKTIQTDLIIEKLFNQRISKYFFQDFLLLNNTKKFLKYLNLVDYRNDYDEIKIDKNNSENILKIFSHVKKQLNSETELIIAYYPLKERFLKKSYNNNFKDYTKSIANKFNFRFIDLEIAFQNIDNPIKMYSKNFTHNNEIGYKLISEYLAKNINN